MRNFFQTSLLSLQQIINHSFGCDIIRIFDDILYHDLCVALLPDCLAELTTDFKSIEIPHYLLMIKLLLFLH